MKKSLALILAAMMVAGTASVAFADAKSDLSVVSANPEVYVWNSTDGVYESGKNVKYGDKIAVKLGGDLIGSKNEDKDIGRYKVYTDWKVGKSLVSDADIEYKKVVTAVEAYDARETVTLSDITLTDLDVGGTKGNYVVKFKTTPATDFEVADASKAKKTEDLINNRIDSITKDGAAATGDDVLEAVKAELKKSHSDSIFNAFYKSANKTKDVYTWVAYLKLDTSNSTKKSDLAGTIRVAKTPSADAVKGKIEISVGYDKNDETNDTIRYKDSRPVVEFDDDATVVDLEFGESGNDALFTVDVEGQSDVNVKFNTKFDSEIASKYPEANLEFVRWTANPVFNRTGDLYIYADEDTFIYEATADGLKEISKAEYDEDYGAWYLRTRKLGTYVISDVELDLAASSSSSEASSSETSSSNPSTGGSTDTTNGNTNVKPNPNTGR